MPVMLACRQVTLDCSWVMTVHLGLVCTGSVPEMMEIQAEVTRPDCIRDCSRCPVERIPQHQESFPYR